MTKMTAEQVANQFDKSADWHRTFGTCAAAMIYRDAATEIREHLIETDEQRRERFEAWHRKRYGPSFDHMLARDWHGYVNGGTNMMWLAFHAALTCRGEAKGGEA